MEDIEALEANNILDTNCSDATIIQIASIIEARMKIAEVYCSECMLTFEKNRKVQNRFNGFKNQDPCYSSYIICKAVYRYLRVQFLRGNTGLNIVYSAIVDQLDVSSLYDATDFEHDPNHKFYLIQAVIDTCVQIKATFLARQANFTGKENMRSRLRKLIHIAGQ